MKNSTILCFYANRKIQFIGFFALISVVFTAQFCKTNEPAVTYSVPRITEYTPEQYADDPDLTAGFSDSLYGKTFSHDGIHFVPEEKDYSKFTIKIFPRNDKSDTLILRHICLDEWIPTIPKYLKGDTTGLADIALFNQQFNRVQAKFTKEKQEFEVAGNHLESTKVTRIDLAKNCLKVPFWEIIAFSANDMPIYHGWFNFPEDLHTKLLIRRGWTPDESPNITELLTSWMKAEPYKPLNLTNLRTVKVQDEKTVPIEVFNQSNYPETGERKKKRKNILFPTTTFISDFLTDSAKFAFFVPPGRYTKNTPMRAQLGLFKRIVQEAKVRIIHSQNAAKSVRPEIELTYFSEKSQITRLLVGGFDVNKIPTSAVADANKGMTMPMGIGNHNFNQSYEDLTKTENSAINNPCYAMLLDVKGVWLNSHTIGVDGVMMHFDDKNPNVLHMWILSFERHALVGHYTIPYDWSIFKKTK